LPFAPSLFAPKRTLEVVSWIQISFLGSGNLWWQSSPGLLERYESLLRRPRNQRDHIFRRITSMSTILIVVVLVLLLGGGGYWGRGRYWSATGRFGARYCCTLNSARCFASAPCCSLNRLAIPLSISIRREPRLLRQRPGHPARTRTHQTKHHHSKTLASPKDRRLRSTNQMRPNLP
jgi:hypothetical protein